MVEKPGSLEKGRQFINNIHSGASSFNKITIHSNDGVHIIPLADIIYLEADGQYTHFYLKGGNRKISSLNLREYEELLGEPDFFRAHRSFIINMNEIRMYIRGENSKVLMSNNTHVDISKRRKSDFIQLLEN